MPNVEPSFVLYALLLEPGGCLRAHITLFELVEPEGKKKKQPVLSALSGPRWRRSLPAHCVAQLVANRVPSLAWEVLSFSGSFRTFCPTLGGCA
jgi:hypothetical protein